MQSTSTDGPSAAARTIRVAAVQMASENGEIEANLRRATLFAEQAARDGARLILFPEFMPTGYAWTERIWDAAETHAGPTATWLAATSRRLGVWLGTSYLETDGADFYNTFVLTTPEGAEAGRVRKEYPALWEAFFTRGEPGPHVINTELGRIGVGICYENYLAFLPRLMHEQQVDFLLMPHSAPSLAETFLICKDTVSRFKADLRDVAAYYAGLLGVPAVMVNKCGPWHSDLRYERPASFPGFSAIADSDGTVRARLDGEEGVIVADVTLDPARKRTSAPPAFGRWARKTAFARTVSCWIPETFGHWWYCLSRARRRKAREIAGRR